eukprot:12490341-Prorocentrum_lima.AAC.1
MSWLLRSLEGCEVSPNSVLPNGLLGAPMLLLGNSRSSSMPIVWGGERCSQQTTFCVQTMLSKWMLL